MHRLLEGFPHCRRLYRVDTFRQLGKKQGTVRNRFENMVEERAASPLARAGALFDQNRPNSPPRDPCIW